MVWWCHQQDLADNLRNAMHSVYSAFQWSMNNAANSVHTCMSFYESILNGIFQGVELATGYCLISRWTSLLADMVWRSMALLHIIAFKIASNGRWLSDAASVWLADMLRIHTLWLKCRLFYRKWYYPQLSNILMYRQILDFHQYLPSLHAVNGSVPNNCSSMQNNSLGYEAIEYNALNVHTLLHGKNSELANKVRILF